MEPTDAISQHADPTGGGLSLQLGEQGDYGLQTRPVRFRLWADPAKQGFNRVKIADLRLQKTE